MDAWITALDPKVVEFWRTAGTIAVALIAGIITGVIQYRQWQTAHRQSRTAQNKLKLDLFDKRMEVYTKISEIVDRLAIRHHETDLVVEFHNQMQAA
jgi:Tfp pilus assembly protein PilN